MRRQQLALTVVQIACLLLAWAFLRHIGGVLRPFDQELRNDAVQQQRHLDRLESRHPGAVARVIAAGDGR